jgi:putative membrane protein
MTLRFKYCKSLLLATGILGMGALTSAQTPPESPAQTEEKRPDDSGTQTKKSADHHFIMEAADGGMAEVQLGQLAVQKASNPDVKAFAQRMVDDHSKANDELKQIASDKGITLPDAISAKHNATITRLSSLSGADFDKAYVDDMLADHKKDVAAFKAEASDGKDSDVKQFAAKTLPTLQDHLKQIQGIASSPKSAANSTN